MVQPCFLLDVYRTLCVFREQSIEPGNKGRNYVCRRLIRRFIRLNPDGLECPFVVWMDEEKVRMEKSIREGRKHYRRNKGTHPDTFYWDTFGVLPEEIGLLEP